MSLACLALLLLASQASAQPAQRLGPTNDRGPRPLVVDVQQDAQARPASPAATARDESPHSARQRLEQQRQVLEAKLLCSQRQLDRVQQYNLHARPGTMSFENSAVLPPSPTLGPVRTSDPVQLFEPRSSFSHVLAAAERNEEAARLELQVVENQLQGADSQQSGPPTPAAPGATTATPAAQSAAEPVSPERTRQVEQELRLAEFRYQSAQSRLDRLQKLGRLTYSQFHSNLSDKLHLEVLQSRLERDRLQSLQQQILQDRRPFHFESGN